MNIEATKQIVREHIEQPLKEQGFEIADLVLSHYKNKSFLRLFIYGQNGITLDACAQISRLVGDLIEPSDLFSGGYTLEVSSPGLDRPLKTLRDYHFRNGETVKITFADRQRPALVAKIGEVNDSRVLLTNETESMWIPLADIEQARIVF